LLDEPWRRVSSWQAAWPGICSPGIGMSGAQSEAVWFNGLAADAAKVGIIGRL
jgi:hypothetical protein